MMRGDDRASRLDSLSIRLCGIPGGMAIVGTDRPRIPLDEESPCRTKAIRPFRMMATTVTNAAFDSFVRATGYVTQAEKFGWSFVLFSSVTDAVEETQAVARAEWWRRVDGADWRHINGPGSRPDWCPEHPVVHVSWHDAREFADWIGGRLPREWEWEHAARGGLGDVPFPWGEREPDDAGFQPCNIWQGRFPVENTCLDGYAATAPARSFQPNGYGLYNMTGNVWEWTADPMKLRSIARAARAQAKMTRGFKIVKGGSFLCHKSYCHRYRIAARSGNSPESAAAHQGFRLVFDCAA